MVKPVIFQIAGYQNSGKTTVMSILINRLRAEGLRVVSIKHHGHGGKPSAVQNKDSSRHLDSGSMAALVEGDGSLLLQAEKPFWTLEEKIQLLSFFNPDVILMEGHKQESFPKLLLLRKREDVKLLKIVSNIKIVVFWNETLDAVKQADLPCFHIDDPGFVDWIISFLKRQLIN